MTILWQYDDHTVVIFDDHNVPLFIDIMTIWCSNLTLVCSWGWQRGERGECKPEIDQAGLAPAYFMFWIAFFVFLIFLLCILHVLYFACFNFAFFVFFFFYFVSLYFAVFPARAALRALGLLLADSAPTVGWGKTFGRVGRVPLTKTDVTRKRKVAQ